MKVLHWLADFDVKQLAQLEENAQSRLDGPKREEAIEVLERITAERGRRSQVAATSKAAAAESIRQQVAGKGLEERVRMAFTEMPPLDWELAALRALAANPGATTEELSEALGFSGTYMNWFGHVCRDRESWLGPPVPGEDGKIIYSSLLVDFGRRSDPQGQSVATWTLRPEAEQALEALRLC